MKLKTNILSSLLLCSTCAAAQHLNLDIIPPSLTIRQDSAVLTMKMTVSAPHMDPKSQIRLVPVISGNGRSESLAQVLLNGEKTQKLYRRTQALNKRRGKKENTPTFAAVAFDGNSQTINYRASVPAAAWMQQAEISLKKEVINGDGDKIQNEIIPIPGREAGFPVPGQERSYTPSQEQEQTQTERQDRTQDNSLAVSPSAPIVVAPDHRPAVTVTPAPVRMHFKGSYISPDSDATDERNQKELNFSLDEARVIAGINPQMLSLRELYTVAISYKNIPAQFYKIIDISVKIYPASPVANLNAAAAAIERGNIQAAGRYLQMASHETLAYKNCRGAYELLCNNTYEGIRLLKAAKAEGSEEATYNLKIFFESNQPANIQ